MDFVAKIDTSELRDKFAKLEKRIDEVTQTTMDESAKVVYTESQRLVPVKTGALKRSGVLVTRKRDELQRPYAYVEYGNDLVPYAVYVHEDLTKHHAEGTQAKFLEAPMSEQEPKFRATLEARIAAVLKEAK